MPEVRQTPFRSRGCQYSRLPLDAQLPKLCYHRHGMCQFRVIVALVWLVAAVAAQASSPSTAVGERPRERPTQAVLSVPSACGAAIAVRTGPSPSPARDAQGLAFLAIPVTPRLSAVAVTAQSSVDIAPQLSALPHRQRGPPLPA